MHIANFFDLQGSLEACGVPDKQFKQDVTLPSEKLRTGNHGP